MRGVLAPKVSVVLPAYNAAPFLASSIGSALEQTMPDFELLVLDNASTDDTPEVVARFTDPRIRYVRNPENRGFAGNVKLGFELARGKYVTLLGADDLFEPTFLERTSSFLDAHEDVGLVHTDAIWIDGEGRAFGESAAGWPKLSSSREAFLNCYRHGFCTSALLMRRERVVEPVWSIEESWGQGADLPLFLWLCVTSRVGYIHTPLVYYRHHEDNLSTGAYANGGLLELEVWGYNLALTWPQAEPLGLAPIRSEINACIAERNIRILHLARIAGKRLEWLQYFARAVSLSPRVSLRPAVWMRFAAGLLPRGCIAALHRFRQGNAKKRYRDASPPAADPASLPQWAGKSGSPRPMEDIEAARSLDRMEIFLTPRQKLMYTLQRLRPQAHRDGRMPVVRLYSPPRTQTRPGDLQAAAPICGIGMDALLVEHGTGSFQMPLGMKMRSIESGTYRASLTLSSEAAGEQSLFEEDFEVPEGLDAEWLLPARNMTLCAGSSLRATISRLESGHASPLYQSMPLHIVEVRGEGRHAHVFGRAGSRALDFFAGLVAVAVFTVPFALVAWYVRKRMAADYPEVARERAGRFRSPLLRYFAPALFCDPSRWVYRGGKLVAGEVFKLETLTPLKRPLVGRLSLLLRQIGMDEWPQLLVLLTGGWSLFGPRAFPNRDGLLAPDGKTVQDSRDIPERYIVAGAVRKPGALSMRVAITPRGSIGVPPWPTAVLYDRYDSLHWSAWYACRLLGRLALTFLWGEAIGEHHGPVELRLATRLRDSVRSANAR